ncbi:MAG: hypothetical protein ABEH59_07435 [Halobacteriales archaeon]
MVIHATLQELQAIGLTLNVLGIKRTDMRDESEAEPYEVGDRVRIDIPDETHPDHQYHGTNGEITAVIPGSETADTEADQFGIRFRVDLEIDEAIEIEAKYVRPPI